jgi:lysophospholipase L1-like esterase
MRATRLSSLAIAIILAVARVAAAEAPSCAVPVELIAAEAKLPATAAKLAAKQPITIVAMGGASTAGVAAGNGETYGYPHRLEEALRQRHPGAAITVINKAVPRQTTADMAARFDQDVVPLRPTLVLWETGTVDAVRGNDVDDFTAALQNGIAALRGHNFDIILIDMQYNPSAGSVIDFAPYLEAMRNEADLENVYLFRRYDIMRYWSENGVFDFVNVPQGRRQALAREVYRCLGDALAEAIDHAAK